MSDEDYNFFLLTGCGNQYTGRDYTKHERFCVDFKMIPSYVMIGKVISVQMHTACIKYECFKAYYHENRWRDSLYDKVLAKEEHCGKEN